MSSTKLSPKTRIGLKTLYRWIVELRKWNIYIIQFEDNSIYLNENLMERLEYTFKHNTYSFEDAALFNNIRRFYYHKTQVKYITTSGLNKFPYSKKQVN